MEGHKIGKVFRYFSNINVAAIEVTDGDINVGDKLHFKGATTDFTQEIDSMQIDGKDVDTVEAGKSVGMKVKDRVRPGDIVFKL